MGKPPTTLNLKDPYLLLDRTSRRVFCISVPRFLCLLHYGDYSSEWTPLEYLLCVVKEVHVCNACLIKTSTIWYPWERGEGRGGGGDEACIIFQSRLFSLSNFQRHQFFSDFQRHYLLFEYSEGREKRKNMISFYNQLNQKVTVPGI